MILGFFDFGLVGVGGPGKSDFGFCGRVLGYLVCSLGPPIRKFLLAPFFEFNHFPDLPQESERLRRGPAALMTEIRDGKRGGPGPATGAVDQDVGPREVLVNKLNSLLKPVLASWATKRITLRHQTISLGMDNEDLF